MCIYLFVIQFNLQLIHILVSSKVYTQCDFYVIPSMTIQDICHNPELNIASFPKYTGTLEASFTEHIGNKGTFKTAHSGKILEMHPCAPISKFASYVPAADHFNPKNALGDGCERVVCIKQIYEPHRSGGILRLQGPQEARAILPEAMCLLFAGALLNMTYSFMDRQQSLLPELPPFAVPQVRFVHAMIAIIHGGTDKAFLIEEYITGPFSKYINNSKPVPLQGLTGTSLELAHFLCFAQHVQYEKSPNLAYTSDFQGK